MAVDADTAGMPPSPPGRLGSRIRRSTISSSNYYKLTLLDADNLLICWKVQQAS